MCLYPKLILNKKYTANKKNNYKVPQIKDERTKYVAVGCGKCMECMKQKMNNWRVRLHEELRVTSNNYFITLTINDESYIKLLDKLKEYNAIDPNGYKMQNLIAKKAVRLWLENIRSKTKKSVKHWIVTELGEMNTERIHLHGILFNIDDINEVMKRWKHGNTYIGNYVNEKTINYIGKYLTKQDIKHKSYTPIVLTSSGIGANYMNRINVKTNRYRGEETNTLYKTSTGHELSLPIYYRNKIYTDEEREKLWLNLLDKQKRFVLGQEIDISKGEEQYEQALKYARHLNTKQGFGTDNKTNDEEVYKKLKSELNWKTRQKLFAQGKLK